MRHLLSILCLLAAATAHAQTIKSLGYNTTNGFIVYGGTNPLKFTNQIGAPQIFIASTNSGELLRIEGSPNDGSDVGFAVYNTTGDQANSFYFNQTTNYVGIGVGDGVGYIQASVPFSLPELGAALDFSGNEVAAATRTNLGATTVGDAVFTATNAAAGAAALDLGSGITTNVTFVDASTNTNSVTISNGIITGWTQ